MKCTARAKLPPKHESIFLFRRFGISVASVNARDECTRTCALHVYKLHSSLHIHTRSAASECIRNGSQRPPHAAPPKRLDTAAHTIIALACNEHARNVVVIIGDDDINFTYTVHNNSNGVVHVALFRTYSIHIASPSITWNCVELCLAIPAPRAIC